MRCRVRVGLRSPRLSVEADNSRTKRGHNSRLPRFARHAGTVSMKDLAREWRISPRALYDLINRQRATGSAAALPRPGRPNILTVADEAVLSELSEELDGNYTWDEITKRFNEETGKEVCTTTVFRFCKDRCWRKVCDKLVPCLTRLSLALSRDKKVQRFARARFSRYVQYCGAS